MSLVSCAPERQRKMNPNQDESQILCCTGRSCLPRNQGRGGDGASSWLSQLPSHSLHARAHSAMARLSRVEGGAMERKGTRVK